MKFTIIGAGAIGGVIGAYLAKGGEDVTFVDVAEDHVKKMQKDGLTIKENDKSFIIPVRAFTLDEFVKLDEQLEAVLLCVKGLHTKEAINSIKHMLTPSSYVVSFQNGLCEQDIATIIGEERTIGCFVNLFADYIEPGVINYGGVGSVFIGELNKTISTRIEKLVDRLSLWGEAKATANIEGYLWGKLSYGIVLTATALTNEPIADVLAFPRYRNMIIALAREALAVAIYKGISPEAFDNWEPSYMYPPEEKNQHLLNQQFHNLVERLRTYTKTRTGIWRDIAVRKRKTEVPIQFNPIVEIGKEAGIDTSLTSETIKMIVEIEEGKREFTTDNLEILVQIYEAKKK